MPGADSPVGLQAEDDAAAVQPAAGDDQVVLGVDVECLVGAGLEQPVAIADDLARLTQDRATNELDRAGLLEHAAVGELAVYPLGEQRPSPGEVVVLVEPEEVRFAHRTCEGIDAGAAKGLDRLTRRLDRAEGRGRLEHADVSDPVELVCDRRRQLGDGHVVSGELLPAGVRFHLVRLGPAEDLLVVRGDQQPVGDPGLPQGLHRMGNQGTVAEEAGVLVGHPLAPGPRRDDREEGAGVSQSAPLRLLPPRTPPGTGARGRRGRLPRSP
jgi:hypothetical protein